MNHGGRDRPRRSPRQQPGGRQPEGRQPEGRQLEGRQLEGRQLEGRQAGGRQAGGRQAGGRQAGGRQAGGGRAAGGSGGAVQAGDGGERAREEREVLLLVTSAETNIQLVLADISSRSHLAAGACGESKCLWREQVLVVRAGACG
ncbi:unnamed protein product [Closterium sp. NIES-64]|nr:unnamed protein product [Closterium sp. NIES-64]CAI6008368.1 unnamed protein product [Closterium sp. NIES-65]